MHLSLGNQCISITIMNPSCLHLPLTSVAVRYVPVHVKSTVLYIYACVASTAIMHCMDRMQNAHRRESMVELQNQRDIFDAHKAKAELAATDQQASFDIQIAQARADMDEMRAAFDRLAHEHALQWSTASDQV